MRVARFCRVTETGGLPVSGRHGPRWGDAVTRAGRPRLTTSGGRGPPHATRSSTPQVNCSRRSGYTGTSTRTIAEAVGIRQASLYHYFKTKDDILCALLSQTVDSDTGIHPEPAGRRAGAQRAPNTCMRWRAFDGSQLLDGRWNLGALYLQPELRGRRARAVLVGPRTAATALPGVEPGHRRRNRRRRGRGRSAVPAGRVAGQHVVDDSRGPERRRLPIHVADACMRVLGMPDSATTRLRARSHLELTRYAATN